MAEALVGAPLISAVINPLIPIAYEKMRHVWGVRTEMTKLHGLLNKIQAVLIDADDKQQEEGKRGKLVNIWLGELKDVAYDVEDVLDEFAYESLQRKMEIQGRARNKIKKDLFLPLNNLAFRFRMSNKIRDLNRRLADIAKEAAVLGLNESNRSPTRNYNGLANRETFSHVDVSEIVGRDVEKSKIISLIVNNSTNDEDTCSIVRIVGMGGVGKTSLAQSVFNDQSVTDHFGANNKLWVYMDRNSDQKDVFARILELTEQKKCDISSLELISRKIKDTVHGKRYLIVLDDIWNDINSEWDDTLKILLNIFPKATKVIVTTRSDEVVSRSSTSSYTHRLERLSEDACWSLFEKFAFRPGGVEKSSDLIKIGKNISKKCGGVPLAVKITGNLMSNKDAVEWQSIADSGIWKLPEDGEKVMRILKLSYDYLQPDLKRCFSYCSLFPKGHNFYKKKLILLWMAEGFLSSSKANDEMEKTGGKYFDFLLTNTFFQEENKNNLGGIESCRMHDLLHDLALYVARTEYCSIRDVTKIHEEKKDSNTSDAMYQVKNLRTFIYFPQEFTNNTFPERVFKNFSCLRVLDLSYGAIGELPSSVAKLKHLRYLDLSNSQVTTLPDSITRLYNLQTLLLINCFQLKVLPGDMNKLINLRHLTIYRTAGTGNHDWIPPMPSKVGNLKCLRSLPVFSVGSKINGYGIEELRDLRLLGDELQIVNLENVSDRKDAETGCLNDKQYIHSLALIWSCIDVVRDDFEVLEGLQPHQNLKRFAIKCYMGSKFSSWMMNMNYLLRNLRYMVLKNCSRCEYLPPLGLLRHLEYLFIEGLDAVEMIGSEFYGSNDSNVASFPSLEVFSISHMVNLEKWSDNVSSSSSSASDFPHLKALSVNNCPKLMITPTRFPSLKAFAYCHSNGEPIRSLVEGNLASLISVKIEYCEELVFLPQGLVRANSFLERLVVNGCKSFKGFNPDQDFEEEEREQVPSRPNNSLHHLSLSECPCLLFWPDLRVFSSLNFLSICRYESQKHIPRGIEVLPKLQYLVIGWFSEELDSFPIPVPNIEEGNLKGRYFPLLRTLSIVGRYKLKCLPDQIQYLTSLEYLSIFRFDSLDALPEWLGNLASLQELRLSYCENLKYMPSGEQMLRLTSLEKLEINNCPLLADRCKPGGEEYNKISHIEITTRGS